MHKIDIGEEIYIYMYTSNDTSFQIFPSVWIDTGVGATDATWQYHVHYTIYSASHGEYENASFNL